MIFLQAFYFFLPAYFANMAPVIAAKMSLPGGSPLSEKHLGTNKTVRGFYAGFLGALLALFLQRYFQNAALFESARLLDYPSLNLALYAFLFGIGAIAGDTLKSFFKRKIGRPSGSSWPPFDQLDFIFGAAIFVSAVVSIPLPIFVAALVLTPLLHLATNVLAYSVGLKKVWW